MAMIFGYLRLADPNNPHIPEYKAKLAAAGAAQILDDPGEPFHRPNFDKIVGDAGTQGLAQAGDVVAVVKLDHLSANISTVVQLIGRIHEQHLHLMVLEPNRVDTRRRDRNEAFGLIAALRAVLGNVDVKGGDNGGNGP